MAKAIKGELKDQKAPEATIGDLVAAAFDAAGGDASKAVRLLSSWELARALGRRVIVE